MNGTDFSQSVIGIIYSVIVENIIVGTASLLVKIIVNYCIIISP